MLIDESLPGLEELETLPESASDCGLYIKDKSGEYCKISIPRDCLAFQIGEAAQVASMGLLVATPHLVRGLCSESIARNTFAVFMQPNVDEMLTPTESYYDFTQKVFNRHYS